MANDRAVAIDALPPLREVIDAHDLRAQKSLGQNFLLDLNITDKIVREAMNRDGGDWSGVHAFEVGPGPGGLTRALLKSPVKQVSAVEYDARAVAALEGLKNVASGDLDVIHGDALKIDLTEGSAAPRVIVANLPYNVATPLLIGWLKQIRAQNNSYQSMALMFQKEVAERIVARPNTKAYGRLAVISQWLCDVQIMYDLPPSAFIPPPKVNSAVVFFKPKNLADYAPVFSDVEQVTAAAFNQRRKMVRSSLKEYLPAIEALHIDPQIRAENLTVAQYLDIAGFH
ncbi:MAG: 16S rRNA (adenine(1518)-N(6)/adenine(1519)-N(6))-dimethyltransferase RsmA [Alphaproteobacteria bacterium]